MSDEKQAFVSRIGSSTPDDDPRVQRIRHAMREAERIIEEECPAGRRKALALTELESASHWAVKSVMYGP